MQFKRNDRVEITCKGEILHGTVKTAGARVTAILDGGKEKIAAPVTAFRPSTKPLPVEPPSTMDGYAVTGFREYSRLSEETVAFSARPIAKAAVATTATT